MMTPDDVSNSNHDDDDRIHYSLSDQDVADLVEEGRRTPTGECEQPGQSRKSTTKTSCGDTDMKWAKKVASPPCHAFGKARLPETSPDVASISSSSSSNSQGVQKDQVITLSQMHRVKRQRRNTKSVPGTKQPTTNDTNDDILSAKQDIASRRSRQSRRKPKSKEQAVEEQEEDDDNEFDEEDIEEEPVVVARPGAVRVQPAFLPSSSTVSKEDVESERSAYNNVQPGPINLNLLATDKNVVKAFAVEEGDVEEPKVLATAEPFEEENKAPRRILICVMIVVMIALAVSLSLALTLTSSDPEESPPTAVPSMTPSMSPSYSSGGLLDMLMEHSLDNGTALMQFGTPQYQAAEWLIYEHETGGESTGSIEAYLSEKAGRRMADETPSLLDTYSNGRILQRYAMATLYFSLGGDTWLQSRNWLDPTVDECLWFMESETPCNKDGELVDLILRQNFLRGSIPPELALLSTAKIIDLSDNAIGSTIPSELGVLGEVTQSLILSSNMLEGTIPTELAKLSGLRVLSLDDNRLLCPETPCVWGFDWVDCNSFNYIFPSEFGELENLVVLSLANNPFAGDDDFEARRCVIPDAIGGLAHSLQKLDLHGIGNSGFLPSTLGMLTNLVQLSLPREKQFWSRNILDTLTNLTALVVLSLSDHFSNFEGDNHFGRTIPNSIGNMTSLKVIRLDSPAFRGTIPTEIGLLANTLESLSLAQATQITGEIPTELGLLTQLTKLELQMTDLSSTIPTELGLLHRRLRYLDLHGQPRESPMDRSIPFIQGTVPSEIGALSGLTHLDLSDLMLTGTLPSDFTIQLTRMGYLGLARTHVTGSIEELACEDNGDQKIPFASASIDMVNCTCCQEYCESYNDTRTNQELYLCRERRVQSDDDYVPPPLPEYPEPMPPPDQTMP